MTEGRGAGMGPGDRDGDGAGHGAGHVAAGGSGEGSDGGSVRPVRRQRIAAYAMVLCAGQILLTQLSDRTGWPGGWTLPGGGLDHGEHPRDAVVRETFEETGQRLVDPVLVDVDSEHFQGVAPDGVLEDYHAVRLLYHGTVAEPGDPVVHDVGGTTQAARWVPLGEVDGLDLVPIARLAVDWLSTRDDRDDRDNRDDRR